MSHCNSGAARRLGKPTVGKAVMTTSGSQGLSVNNAHNARNYCHVSLSWTGCIRRRSSSKVHVDPAVSVDVRSFCLTKQCGLEVRGQPRGGARTRDFLFFLTGQRARPSGKVRSLSVQPSFPRNYTTLRPIFYQQSSFLFDN